MKVLPLESRSFNAVAEVPGMAVRFVAQQVGVNPKVFADYDSEGRTAKRDRVVFVNTSVGDKLRR